MNGLLFGSGFDTIFTIMYFVIFTLVIGGFIAIFASAFLRWNKNNKSPKLVVEATVVSKRQDVRRRRNSNGHRSSFTYYYVTFQVNTGDRMELNVGGMDYGMLAEGDVGTLTFQGTRYLGFERKF